jgi:hypothetical protein
VRAAANTFLEDYRRLWEARFAQRDVLLHDIAADEASAPARTRSRKK